MLQIARREVGTAAHTHRLQHIITVEDVDRAVAVINGLHNTREPVCGRLVGVQSVGGSDSKR